MRGLLIDSTRPVFTAALITDTECFASNPDAGNKRHTAVILPTIDALLKTHGIDGISELDFCAGVTGPGSFTGIRVGLAMLNAFHAATGVNLIGITALEAAAFEKDNCVAYLPQAGKDAYSLIKKGDSQEYTSLYDDGINALNLEKIEVCAEKLANMDETARLLRQKFSENKFDYPLAPFYIKPSSADKLLLI
ncbi:MAG: tRNA (adenosine(37)-N6)-threonylcarbamoyltransferase complex dimerization subunit type 1 TsaB [Christensenellaceae bacterium]|nr:tRNA (adenosine(37)-N6)-threonylcarbamoyltransferase complex dimerization subunit type 1 TsaB [Christensenellaceae bacterium]